MTTGLCISWRITELRTSICFWLKRSEFDPALRTAKDGSTVAEIAHVKPSNVCIDAVPSLSTVAGLAHTMPCQVDGKGPFVEDLRVELSATGVLTLHVSPLDKRSIDLSDSNAAVTLPKVSKRPFCLHVTQSKLNQCVLDASTGLHFEKWRQALCRFASLRAPQLYSFSISLCGEQMGEFSIRYSAAGVFTRSWRSNNGWTSNF